MIQVNGAIVRAIRFLDGLRRPSRAANARRLRERGERATSFIIREATLPDVPALAKLHVTTFNETHRLFGQGPSFELRERQWREKLENADGGLFCFVVENGRGELVGFASGMRSDDPGFTGLLEKIYLLRAYQRLALGRRLVGHVAGRFLEGGMSSMMLFSQAVNPSCGFFEALEGERLVSPTGTFHGAYGWRDLERLADICPRD